MLETVYYNEKIGKHLLKDDLINKDQWKEALEIHSKKGGFIGKILVEKEFLAEEELLSYFLEKFGVPYLPISQFPINPESKKFIPKDMAKKYLLLPVDHQGYRLVLIAPGPIEVLLLSNALEACKGFPLIYFLSSISDLERAIEKLYS